jgi:2-methylisocitrate lyase-like PEP mutase family enzyme
MAQMSVKDILSRDSVTIMPGVFDGVSAKLAQKAGIKAAAVTGFSVAATQLGVPDIGLMTQTQLLTSAKTICKSVDIPILVDCDTGYGGPLNVINLMQELQAMGAKGAILEDQVWPKRCGHMRGKQVVDCSEHVAKIKAAKSAIKSEEFFIVGRTDARAIHGLDDAIERGKRYFDAGADLIFVEAPQNVDEIEQVSKSFDCPIMLNIVEGGRTPILTRDEIMQLGFSVVTYPLTGLFAACRAIENSFKNLIDEGVGDNNPKFQYDFDEFNSLIGLEQCYEIADKFKP